MLDLAPRNPYGLTVASPLLARAGLRGAGVDKLLHLPQVGAVLSDPLRHRQHQQRGFVPIPAGVLHPAGGRSITQAQRDLGRWNNASKPVIVAIQPQTPTELRDLLKMLDQETTTAVLLDVSEVDEPTATTLIQTTRKQWERPLLVECALDQPIASIVNACNASIDALVFARGPRGAAHVDGTTSTGRMIGYAIDPLSLSILLSLREITTLPLISGAATESHATTLLQSGATAVLVDVGLWLNPDSFQLS